MKINFWYSEKMSQPGYELQCAVTDDLAFSQYYLSSFIEECYFTRWLYVVGVNR